MIHSLLMLFTLWPKENDIPYMHLLLHVFILEYCIDSIVGQVLTHRIQLQSLWVEKVILTWWKNYEGVLLAWVWGKCRSLSEDEDQISTSQQSYWCYKHPLKMTLPHFHFREDVLGSSNIIWRKQVYILHAWHLEWMGWIIFCPAKANANVKANADTLASLLLYANNWKMNENVQYFCL